MSKPPEHTTRDMKLKISICPSFRANSFYTFQYETPCSVVERKIERQRSIQNIVDGDRIGGARFLRNTIQSVPQNKNIDSHRK